MTGWCKGPILSQVITVINASAAVTLLEQRKNFQSLSGIRTHDLCDDGAVLSQLSYQSHMSAVVYGLALFSSTRILHPLASVGVWDKQHTVISKDNSQDYCGYKAFDKSVLRFCQPAVAQRHETRWTIFRKKIVVFWLPEVNSESQRLSCFDGPNKETVKEENNWDGNGQWFLGWLGWVTFKQTGGLTNSLISVRFTS